MITVTKQWMREEICYLLGITRSLWKGLVLIGSFYCCTIPEKVLLLLPHFEESEAQEQYIIRHGYNWAAAEAGFEPSYSDCPAQGIFKNCCSSTPILKSLPRPTSVPSSHNHSALWSSSLFDFQRLTQNQRSILELSVSPDRQKQDSSFGQGKSSMACRQKCTDTLVQATMERPNQLCIMNRWTWQPCYYLNMTPSWRDRDKQTYLRTMTCTTMPWISSGLSNLGTFPSSPVPACPRFTLAMFIAASRASVSWREHIWKAPESEMGQDKGLWAVTIIFTTRR